jgi:hypothetical protein
MGSPYETRAEEECGQTVYKLFFYLTIHYIYLGFHFYHFYM